MPGEHQYSILKLIPIALTTFLLSMSSTRAEEAVKVASQKTKNEENHPSTAAPLEVHDVHHTWNKTDRSSVGGKEENMTIY